MDLEQLQDIADQVGVGYTGLDEAELRQKIKMEGTPLD